MARISKSVKRACELIAAEIDIARLRKEYAHATKGHSEQSQRTILQNVKVAIDAAVKKGKLSEAESDNALNSLVGSIVLGEEGEEAIKESHAQAVAGIGRTLDEILNDVKASSDAQR